MSNQPTNQFANITEDELQRFFIEASTGPRENGNIFFNRFKYVYDLFGGNYSAALSQGIDLLIKCQSFNSEAYDRIHKGSAYYWIGIASFMVQDYELAAFFFDAAVTEDIRAGNDPVNNSTPSFRFILIEGDIKEQAARPLVQQLQKKIEELINDYNNRPRLQPSPSPFTLEDLRLRFLRLSVSPGYESWRSSATTLLSFCMEWEYRNLLLNLRPLNGTAEPFFMHLFKGCVLFETLLKSNRTIAIATNTTLGNVIRELHNQLFIPENINIGNTNFPEIISDLKNADNSIQTAIEFTGRIRNTLGHNLGWVVEMSNSDYEQLFKMVSSSCIHAISCLY